LRFHLVINFYIQICEPSYAKVPKLSKNSSFWNWKGPTTKMNFLLPEYTWDGVFFAFFVISLHPCAKIVTVSVSAASVLQAFNTSLFVYVSTAHFHTFGPS